MRTGLFFALVSLLLAPLGLAPAAASAQAEIAELREQVDALRANRPPNVSEGALVSLDYSLDVATRIERQFGEESEQWRTRVERYLAIAQQGRDPYLEQSGRITNRGYDSPISTVRQGYAVYLPPDYDPSRRYPLLVMLHGGSSNGNLFLGVVLGNNMDWLTYDEHLWDEYTPRWSPDWIVVAPDGFGQVLWRWMGEADILAVVDDVQRHYAVDADRVVLGGLSNGGLGSYAVGMRHAWRFSQVTAIAGAPSWLQYTGGSPTRQETATMTAWSGMHLAENSVNTDFRFFHGTQDPGPMRPAFVREMEAHMTELGLTPNVRWFEHGHDLLYLVHRHGRVYPEMARVTRNRRPEEVRVVTGDYRANRQHWVTVTRIEQYPELARVVARATDGALTVQTTNTLELSLDLRDAPIGAGNTLRIDVDGAEVYAGGRGALGHLVRAHRGEDGRWRLGRLPRVDGLEKVPGLSGPLTDPYRDGMIHVYGTQVAEQTEALRTSAQRGARGWPLWLWNHQQRVVADTEVTDEMMRSSHLVLYGTPGSNAVIERIQERLPIHVASDAIVVGTQRITGTELGTRFVFPNPEAPGRYVIVQEGQTVAAVNRGHNLPDFLPDWVVYDPRSSARRARLISGRNGQVAMGYFDRFWRVPAGQASATIAERVRGRVQAIETSEDPLRAGPRMGALAGSAPLAGDRGTYFEGGDDGPTDVTVTHDGTTTPPSTEERSATSPSAEGPLSRAPEERASAVEGSATQSPLEPTASRSTDVELTTVATPPLTPREQRIAARRAARELQRTRARILGVPIGFHIPPQVLLQTPPIELPIAEPPPTPARPRRFAARPTDPAGVVARELADLVPTFLNFRGIVPGARWTTDATRVWQIQNERDCLARLRAAHIQFARYREPLETSVPTPIELRGAIDGVTIRTVRPGERVVLACELVARLPEVTRVLRAHDIVAMDVLSAYRPGPRQSFHTLGLALDIASFETSDGTVLNVETDFLETPRHETCDAPSPEPSAARTLLEIACTLADDHAFSTVLTPNYNEGHRNHFHLDARPDDPRFYVR
ncbi:MAG: extensin family protein [Deltaproteobacteria bacterium]|nr:extensin family protein [Deltaproteobacteria bacterium]